MPRRSTPCCDGRRHPRAFPHPRNTRKESSLPLSELVFYHLPDNPLPSAAQLGREAIILHILVVDDESAVCEVIRTALQDTEGFQVSCAYNGSDAARALAEAHPDLGIFDAVLPDLSGLELAAMAASRGLPAVVMTGYLDLCRFFETTPLPLLRKPFGLDKLLEEAHRALHDAEGNRDAVRLAIQRCLEPDAAEHLRPLGIADERRAQLGALVAGTRRRADRQDASGSIPSRNPDRVRGSRP